MNSFYPTLGKSYFKNPYPLFNPYINNLNELYIIQVFIYDPNYKTFLNLTTIVI